MTWAKTTASSTKRGYGTKHRKLRDALLPSAYGTPCVRCGHAMLPGQILHLDHNDTRTGYIGFSHKYCNMAAAARHSTRVRVARRKLKKQLTDSYRW